MLSANNKVVLTASMPLDAYLRVSKSASILCFCETWLTPPEPSPVVHDNHTNIRCDRASGDNKGGVMISISDNSQAV